MKGKRTFHIVPLGGGQRRDGAPADQFNVMVRIAAQRSA
jgi:hypothetical protein